jgi:transposase-like protein
MARRRNQTHSAAFREEAIRQAQARGSSHSWTKIAEDLGVKDSTLRPVAKGSRGGTGEDAEMEQNEVRRLRREVRELRMERAILKKRWSSSPNTHDEVSIHRRGEGPLSGPAVVPLSRGVTQQLLCVA